MYRKCAQSVLIIYIKVSPHKIYAADGAAYSCSSFSVLGVNVEVAVHKIHLNFHLSFTLLTLFCFASLKEKKSVHKCK